MPEIPNWPTAVTIIGVAFAVAWAIIHVNRN